MKYLLVLNPVSGGGRNHHKLNKALGYFRKKGDFVEVARTSVAGDGARVVRARRGEFDAVIAAGGDGTIHEVIEGLAGTPTPLGILPWGTGNVFAREMSLPWRTKALCKRIRRGRVRTLDVGLADGRPFLLMVSVGLDAYTLGTMVQSRFKRLWGMASYALAGLGALARYHYPDIQVTFDDGTTDRGGFVLVSNTRLYGAFFTFHPQADPSDGYLDVLVFRHNGRWKFLGMAFHMAWHGLMDKRGTRPAAFLSQHGIYRTKGLKIASGHQRQAQADGDFLPGGVVDIGIYPGALRVLV